MDAMIYLDHHSATRPCSAALERMTPYLQEHWGASFAPHRMGQELIAALDSRYQMLYDLVGAKPADRCVFTSSGAEAVNQVFWSVFVERARKEGKTHLIVSNIEDAPTLQCAKRLEELGCTVKTAPANAKGEIDLEELAQLINPRTSLISVTMAHGLTGVIQPVDQIVRLAKEKKVLLHLDATYAVGKYPIEFPSDYLTFSGDRIHAMALEIVRLRDLFEAEVHGQILYKDALRLPNTSLIAFENVHQEALLYFLNRKGVYATIGGPYAAHLSRIARDETAISFSLSRMTTEEEVLRGARVINETLRELRAISERL